MGRWLGVDHGTQRIGLAAGGTDDGIASPLEVIQAQPHQAAIEKIRRVAAEYAVDGIVVGYPLNMDDTEGPQGYLARKLATELVEATRLDVRLWDERLSSFAADQALKGMLTRKKKKARQDAVAAASFLADFLQHEGPQKALRPGEIKGM